MKKKILLTLAIMAMLICVFAISVSAAVVTDAIKYSYFPQNAETESIDGITAENHIHADILANYPEAVNAKIRLMCSCAKGYHIYPTYYVTSVKEAEYFRFDYTEINKVNPCGQTYNKNTIIALEMPNGYTIFDGYAEGNNVIYGVRKSSTLEYIDMSSCTTLATLSTEDKHEPFNNCSALKYVKMSSATTNLPAWGFYDCKELLIVDFPRDSRLEKIGAQAFIGCSKLTALYLPDSVKSIGYLSDGTTDKEQTEKGGKSVFYGCTNLFFVNNPEDTVKPSVYYMPRSLEKITGELFKNFDTINDVVVFGENFTCLNNGFAFAQVNKGTFIFEGDFTAENTKFEYSCEISNLNMYFTHPNVKDGSFIRYATSWNGATPSNCYAYICSTGLKAELTKQSYQEANALYYAVLNFTQDGFVHLEDVRKVVISKEPNCVDNALKNTYCFCGAYMGEVEIENSNYGGKHDLENATLIDIVYDDFTSNGTKVLKCPKCSDDSIAGGEALALFVCLGYSAPENGTGGIAIGFTVNNVAIAEYEKATGKTLTYGVFAVSQERLGDNDIFGEDGAVAEGVINAEIANYDFEAFELKIVGFTDEQKDIKLAMGAYVAVTDGETTEYSYMQDDTKGEKEVNYYFVSYNDVVGSVS